MSLINDALKKAQNLQPRSAGALSTFPRPNTPATGATESTGTSTTIGPPPASAALAPRKGKSPHTALIVVIATTVLLAGVGAIGYVVYALFFMGTPAGQAVASATPPPAAVKPAKAPAPAKATPPAATADETSAEPTAAPETPAPTTTAKSAPAPKAARTPAAPVASSPPAPAPTVTTPPTVAATPPPPASAPEPVVEEVEERINNPKPHIQAWVDKITVSGIRPGDRPKALLNDRVYLIGDVVNRELGLQLLKISDRVLVFEDSEGNTYDYSF